MNSVYYYNPKNGTNNLITYYHSNELSIHGDYHYCGNFNYMMYIMHNSNGQFLLSNQDSNNQVPLGSQEVSLRNVVKGDNLSTIQMTFHASAIWGGLSIIDFKLKLDNEYYTLKQAVDNNKIEPLVLLASTASGSSYLVNNVLNWYNGNLFGGNYGKCQCSFILKSEVEFSGVSFTNNGSSCPIYRPGYTDGFYVNYLPYVFNII